MRTPLRTVLLVSLVVAAIPGVGVAAADAGPVAATDVDVDRPSVAADRSTAVDAAPAGDDPPPASQTAAACEFPVTRTDATGADVTVESKPARIVTLAPSAAQTMWEIGGSDAVVGVSRYAAYLEGAGAKTNVSGAGQTFVDVEQVVGLEPDLVLAPNVVPNETVDKLRSAGVTVYKFRPAPSIEFVEEKTLLIGRLTGHCEGARETVDWMTERLDAVERAVDGEPRPRVLYVTFGYAAGSSTFVHDVLTTAGGRNVAAAANITGFGQISDEVIVRRNPEWLVLNSDAPTVPRSAAYNSTDAVRNDRVVVVDANYVSQPAPRVVRVVEKLARAFHPEVYARAANATASAGADADDVDASLATATEAAESTPGSPRPATGSSPSPTATVEDGSVTTARTDFDEEGGDATSTSTPGFGPGAAIAALLAVVAAAAAGSRP
jgi:iron complex transport system substrate-binding protein